MENVDKKLDSLKKLIEDGVGELEEKRYQYEGAVDIIDEFVRDLESFGSTIRGNNSLTDKLDILLHEVTSNFDESGIEDTARDMSIALDDIEGKIVYELDKCESVIFKLIKECEM